MRYIHKNLEYTTNTQYRSGYVLQDVIKSGESLLSIPFNLMINSYNIKRNQWSNFISFNNFECLNKKFDSGDQWDIPGILLYLFLIKGRKILMNEITNNDLKKGFSNESLENLHDSEIIKRYIRYLPTEFPTLPLWMNSEDISLLKGTHLYIATNKMKEKLNSFLNWLQNHDFIKKDEILSQGIDYDDIKWAYSVAWSRVFPIRMPDENSPIIPTLLPVVDTMNHKYAVKRTYLTDYGKKCFILRTDEDIDTLGQEVFNNYGAKSNESFLFSYGFVQSYNTHDTYFVQLGFSNIIDPYSRQVLIEWNKEILKKKFRFYLEYGKSIPEDLWKTMRVCLLNDQEQYFLSLKKEDEDWLGFISFRNELEVLTTLRRLFVQRLNAMPFDANEDLNRLESGECTINEYNILTYRYSQQKMVLECIDEIDRKLDILHRDFFSLLQELELTTIGNSKYYNYEKLVEYLPEKCSINEKEILLENNFKAIGNILGSIPQKHIMHPATFISTEVGGFLHEVCDISNNSTLLQIWIMIQKFVFPKIGIENHWTRFFYSLPDSFGSLLEDIIKNEEFFDSTTQSIDIIDSTQEILEEVRIQVKYISKKISQYESRCNELSELAVKVLIELKQALTFDNVLWAHLAKTYCLVHSDYGDVIVAFPFTLREKPNAYLASDEGSSNVQLNIRFPSQSNYLSVSGDNWMRCLNQDLLISHGCLLHKNPTDFIYLELNLKQFREAKRARLLRQFNLTTEHFLDWYHEPIKLINTICVAFMNDEELHDKLSITKVWSHIKDFESAIKYAIEILNNLLKDFSYNGTNSAIISFIKLQKQLIEENLRKIENYSKIRISEEH